MVKFDQSNGIEKIAHVLENAFSVNSGYGIPISLGLNIGDYQIADMYEGYLQRSEDLSTANNRIADAILELAKAIRESKEEN